VLAQATIAVASIAKQCLPTHKQQCRMIYFISDQHLGLGEREADKARERDVVSFLKLLEHKEQSCERLFILGDLFDYWFEYNTVVPKFHIRVLAALAALAERGVQIDYLIGNHDFGHRTFFEEELGIRIHKTDLSITLHDKRFYLAHGDGKAFNDTGYILLRSILRNPLALWLWKWIHPDVGVGLAASVSRKSRAYTSEKSYGNERDGLECFAEQKIKEGYDFVLMGHLHKPLVKRFAGEEAAKEYAGTYINTGDWLTHRTFARFQPTTQCLELCSVDAFFAEAGATTHSQLESNS
jgi:UDP-2,3-diacylglucosamine hydrolase